MHPTWLDTSGSLLGTGFPLSLTDPFTPEQAHAAGVRRRALQELVRAGLVRRVLRGVYAATQAPDDVLIRATALALVVPPTAVVTDRTAAWLHGVEILPRSALTVAPPVEVVHVDDTRVRRPEVDGRRRELRSSDITTLHGVRVTTALRTSLDLGRLLWRGDALAAIDGFLRIGVPHPLMSAEIVRFKGFRGVRQLRTLVPLGDPLSESPGEAAARLGWYDAGLGRPVLQRWVHADDGTPVYRLDISDEEVPFAVEYDGVDFHTSDADTAYDEERRRWLEEERGWHVEVVTKEDVYRPGADLAPRLQQAYAEARRGMSRWTPRRRTA
jgi:hypothetical protein